MDPVNFAYWLYSQFELSDVKSFNKEQTLIIKRHAELVLKTIEINEAKKTKPYTAKPGLPPRPVGETKYRC